jgi:hypothetical protein
MMDILEHFPFIFMQIISLKEFQFLILYRTFQENSLKALYSYIFDPNSDILLKRESSIEFFERNDQQETRSDVQNLN